MPVLSPIGLPCPAAAGWQLPIPLETTRLLCAPQIIVPYSSRPLPCMKSWTDKVCSLQALERNTDIVRNSVLIAKNSLAAQQHSQKVTPLELAFCRQHGEWVYNSADKKNCILLEQLTGSLPLFAGGLTQIRNGIHACCLLSWKEGAYTFQ